MEQNVWDMGREEEPDAVYEICREREFAEVYDRYVGDVYRLCFSFMKNRMDAEDAVQETFLKYYRLQKKFDSMEHRKAWLIVTASNHCKDLLKQWWRRGENLDDWKERAGKEEPMVDEMMDLVMKLPEKYKTAVYLYYYEGYDSKEIAEMLHRPASTIRTYLQKARKLLKQEI